MDQVTRSVERITDSPDFVTVPNVPVYDEHDEYDGAGKLTLRVDKAYLTELAKRINARNKLGSLGTIGPGHTIPDQFDDDGNVTVAVPEELQPPIWGYWSNARVEPFGPQGKLGLLVDYHVMREVEERQKDGTTKLVDGVRAVKERFPRPSVELWPVSKIIDWIALLRRTPQRDVGQMVYSRERHEVVTVPIAAKQRRYDRNRRPLEAIANERRLCYSMESSMATEPAPDAMAPDKDFNDKVMRCMKGSYPHLERMHSEAATRYAADQPGNGDDIDGLLDDKPTNNAATVPTFGDDKPKPGAEEDKLRMSRQSSEIRIARLEKELAGQKKERQEEARRYSRDAAEKEIIQLESTGFVIDRAFEVDQLAGDLAGTKAGMPRDQWPAHLERLQKYSRQDGEVGTPMRSRSIPVRNDVPDRGLRNGSAPRKYSREQIEAVEKACERNGTPYETELANLEAKLKQGA